MISFCGWAGWAAAAGFWDASWAGVACTCCCCCCWGACCCSEVSVCCGCCCCGAGAGTCCCCCCCGGCSTALAACWSAILQCTVYCYAVHQLTNCGCAGGQLQPGRWYARPLEVFESLLANDGCCDVLRCVVRFFLIAGGLFFFNAEGVQVKADTHTHTAPPCDGLLQERKTRMFVRVSRADFKGFCLLLLLLLRCRVERDSHTIRERILMVKFSTFYQIAI